MQGIGKAGVETPAGSWRITRRLFLAASAGLAVRAAAPPLRFGVVTDIHYADRPPAGTRYYRLGLSKLRACIDLMNAEGVDFAIELGDFKDQDVKPAEETTLSYLRAIEEIFAAFRGPRYHVLGNHDMDSIAKPQFQSMVVNTGIPRERTFYSFDRGGCHFVVLDANFKADMTAYDKGNFDWRDTNVSPDQVEWLASDLKAASGPVIVAVHQRLDEGEEPCIGNREAVRRVMEQSGKVALVLQGHVHTGAYQQIKGIHYYTLVASIERDNPADATCAIVRVAPDGIEITGHERARSRKL